MRNIDAKLAHPGLLGSQPDEDLAQGGTELEVGGQVQHGDQGHETAQKRCRSDKHSWVHVLVHHEKDLLGQV